MKKFFEDNTLKAQPLTRETVKYFFGVPDELMEGVLKTEKFVVIHNYQDNNYSVQICFNILPSLINNNYLILIFDDDDNLLLADNYGSHTIYPPVWNREFGYLDYTDFVGIQKRINEHLNKINRPTMGYDFSLQKRSFYFTKEDPIKEIPELLKAGKSYDIIQIFAEKKPELAEAARQMMGFSCDL